jgi:predicted metal-binding membrane protein
VSDPPVAGLPAVSADRRAFFGLLIVIAAVAAIAWLVTGLSAVGMSSSMMVMMASQSGWAGFGFFLLVWSVMMIAMMFPAAAPMVRAFVTLSAPPGQTRSRWWTASTAAFLGVYILVWAAAGIAVALGYLLLSPRLGELGTSGTLGVGIAGAVLIAAGVYQTTPLKQTCLAGCRSPLTFLLRYWRKGVRGTVNLGLRHASYCVGCCALLFAVLFAVGVMALPWMAFLAVVIFVEKALPVGHWASFAFGGLFVALGASFLFLPSWGAFALGIG